ncbi:hypothetical protein V6N13_065110 [Hibiscus sabdariffa]
MDGSVAYDNDLNLKATELRLGLPGTHDERRRQQQQKPVSNVRNNKRPNGESEAQNETAPPPKAQIVGWPPVRSYRRNNSQPKKTESEGGAIYIKAIGNMFKFNIGEYSEREGYKGSDYAPTYEDKDGDWMLVGDVPWEMFITSCKRLRIMKGSEARGLGCDT